VLESVKEICVCVRERKRKREKHSLSKKAERAVLTGKVVDQNLSVPIHARGRSAASRGLSKNAKMRVRQRRAVASQ
jgi:hypothetical protein